MFRSRPRPPSVRPRSLRVAFLSAAILGLPLSAGPAAAQSPYPSGELFNFEPFAGVYFPDDVDYQMGESGFGLDDNRLMVGARVGYRLPRNLFLEASVAYSPLRFVKDNTLTNINTFVYSGVLGYDFQLLPRASFYVLGGASVTQWMANGLSAEEGFGAVVGGGLRAYLMPTLSLRADFKDHLVPGTLDGLRAHFNPGMELEGDVTNNVELTLAVAFSFPARHMAYDATQRFDAAPVPPEPQPAAPAIPVDADGDGVADDADGCLGTVPGVPVDARGCPLDSDRDTVHDGLDRCPGTPSGMKVDDAGCPIDSDGDSVLDGYDRCPNTPRGREVDERGCTMVEAGIAAGRLSLNSVKFQTNSAVLTPAARVVLDDVGRALLQRPGVRIEVQGHTDSVGDADYNLRLSETRAQAVFNYLVKAFPPLDAGRFLVRGYGETQPVDSNATASGRALNRRVEFVIRQ